jgi:hypothetical protein
VSAPHAMSWRYSHQGGEDHSGYCDRLRQDEARLRVELTRVRTLLASSAPHEIHLTGIENSVTTLLRGNPELTWTTVEICRGLVTNGNNHRVKAVRATLARLVNKCVVIRVGPGIFRAVPTVGQEEFYLAKNGLLPAEALPTRARGQLVVELHGEGFTDVQIAERTRMTTYTASRIRAALGLDPNRSRVKGLGA